MDYEIVAYSALGLFAALYVVYRILGERAIKKLVRAEVEHVLNNDEHKVKGRYE